MATCSLHRPEPGRSNPANESRRWLLGAIHDGHAKPCRVHRTAGTAWMGRRLSYSKGIPVPQIVGSLGRAVGRTRTDQGDLLGQVIVLAAR
jgi:hypothetical protein